MQQPKLTENPEKLDNVRSKIDMQNIDGNWFHSNANAITKRKGIVNRCNTNKKGLRNLNTQSFERKEKENYVNRFWWNECLSRLSVRKWMKNKKCIEMSANSIKKINGEKESGLFLLLYKILYAKFLSKETRSNKSNINIFSSNFSVIVDPSLVCWWHCISSRSAKHRVHLHKLHCRCTFQSRISCFCTTMQMFPYEFYTYLHTSHSDWLSENVSVCKKVRIWHQSIFSINWNKLWP